MSFQVDMYKKYNDGLFKKLRGGDINDPGGDLPQVAAISGTEFHSVFATRVFPTYTGKTGAQLMNSTGRAWLVGLNPGFITHKVAPATEQAVMDWAEGLYNSHGIRSLLTVGEPHETYTNAQWVNMIDKIASMGNAIWVVCGQNEINHDRNSGAPPANWEAIAAAHQEELWNRIGDLNVIRATQDLEPILVGNCNLWSGSITEHDADGNSFFPSIVDFLDCITWHLYPRGDHPDWNLDRWGDFYQGHFGTDKPIFCTEAGYFVALNYGGGAIPVSEWAQDIYLRKMWLEYAVRGWHVGQFEFVNDPDAADSNREANLGMVETPSVSAGTWTAMDAYTNLSSMCEVDGGTAGNVGLIVEGATSSISQLVVKHATGVKLYLWRRVKLENSDTSGPATLSPANIAVTVTSDAGIQNVNVAHDVVELDI